MQIENKNGLFCRNLTSFQPKIIEFNEKKRYIYFLRFLERKYERFCTKCKKKMTLRIEVLLSRFSVIHYH